MEAARHVYPEIAINLPRPKAKELRGEAKHFEFNKFIFILLFFGLACFVNVYQQALVAQNSIEIDKLKNNIKEEVEIGKNLNIQHMLLKSPSRVERLATELGMIKPAKVSYIVMPLSLAYKPKVLSKAKTKNGLDSIPGGYLITEFAAGVKYLASLPAKISMMVM